MMRSLRENVGSAAPSHPESHATPSQVPAPATTVVLRWSRDMAFQPTSRTNGVFSRLFHTC